VSDFEELVGVSHRRWWGWFCRVLFCIVWNSGVVEVASTTCADIIEEFSISTIFTTIFTTKW